MPRLRYRALHSPSLLEDRFLMLWRVVDGLPLEYGISDLRPLREAVYGAFGVP
jgi:hypothetical protein